jgi:hypothetical protein
MVRFLLSLKPKPKPAELRQLPVYMLNEKMKEPRSVDPLIFYVPEDGLLSPASLFIVYRFVHRSDAIKAYIPLTRS